MGDDGLGEYVVSRLKFRPWPGNVRLVNMACSPLNFLNEIQQADTLIVVDAIRAGTQPGTIHRITQPGPLKTGSASDNGFARNSHGFSILDTVELARIQTGRPYQVIIYGIEPSDCKPGIGLSPPVINASHALEQLVYRDCLSNWQFA